MDGNCELRQPIDYAAYKARALELRRQDIDRLLGRFDAWLTAIAREIRQRNRAQQSARDKRRTARAPTKPVQTARC
jgi:hypothetical protein